MCCVWVLACNHGRRPHQLDLCGCQKVLSRDRSGVNVKTTAATDSLSPTHFSSSKQSHTCTSDRFYTKTKWNNVPGNDQVPPPASHQAPVLPSTPLVAPLSPTAVYGTLLAYYYLCTCSDVHNSYHMVFFLAYSPRYVYMFHPRSFRIPEHTQSGRIGNRIDCAQAENGEEG